ncbi:MAG: hypothetical protein IME94_06335 [Proteobacteria bacterium]|nr:hypothetical protein [Pseudomonadota bacterium]
MCEVIEVQLEWKYSPENYFEEFIPINGKGFDLSISNGIVTAKIEPLFHSENPDIKKNLTNLIENRFLTVQVMSHKDFTLSKPSRSDLRKDGGKNVFAEAEFSCISILSMSADVITQDKDGKIVSSTKHDRLDKQKCFAEKLDKYRDIDSTLGHILKSYQMAVKDPGNELIHLFEILDAFLGRFGKEKDAINQLGTTKSEWDAIARLSNHEPIEEGRHRGQHAGKLRKAEKNELERARKAALNLIEKYLQYLEVEQTISEKNTKGLI